MSVNETIYSGPGWKAAPNKSHCSGDVALFSRERAVWKRAHNHSSVDHDPHVGAAYPEQYNNVPRANIPAPTQTQVSTISDSVYSDYYNAAFNPPKLEPAPSTYSTMPSPEDVCKELNIPVKVRFVFSAEYGFVPLFPERSSKEVGVSVEEGNYNNLEEGNYNNLEEGEHNNLEEGNYNNLEEGNYNNLEEGEHNNLEEGNYNNLEEGNYNNLEEGNYNNLEEGEHNNLKTLKALERQEALKKEASSQWSSLFGWISAENGRPGLRAAPCKPEKNTK